jgi:hypothetical protein
VWQYDVWVRVCEVHLLVLLVVEGPSLFVLEGLYSQAKECVVRMCDNCFRTCAGFQSGCSNLVWGRLCVNWRTLTERAHWLHLMDAATVVWTA